MIYGILAMAIIAAVAAYILYEVIIGVIEQDNLGGDEWEE